MYLRPAPESDRDAFWWIQILSSFTNNPGPNNVSNNRKVEIWTFWQIEFQLSSKQTKFPIFLSWNYPHSGEEQCKLCIVLRKLGSSNNCFKKTNERKQEQLMVPQVCLCPIFEETSSVQIIQIMWATYEHMNVDLAQIKCRHQCWLHQRGPLASVLGLAKHCK